MLDAPGFEARGPLDAAAPEGRADRPDRAVDVAIIGAGPCGLGTAWQIERRRGAGGEAPSYLVVDENARPGGSAASVTTPEGFVFDFGGHILYPHEHYSDFVALLDELVGEWHESKPVRGVWTEDRFIPYPVQRNIHRLPARKLMASLYGLGTVSLSRRLGLRRGRSNPRDDLESHLRRRFGRGLTQLVLGPLNRKMWAHEPGELDSSWTHQRSGSKVANVPDASVRQILRSIVTRQDNPGWTDSTRIRYPLAGGTGAIWETLGRRLPDAALLCGTRVVAIEAAARRLVLSSGERVGYRHLISSMPLDRMLALTDAPSLTGFAGRLHYAGASFVGLGVRAAAPGWLAGVHSFHMPDANIPCWRVSFPAALSPGNVPAGPHWSILAEISHPSAERPDLDAAADDIEAQLRRRGILPADAEVVSRWRASMRHGYPVPFLGRDKVLKQIHGELGALGIMSRGRFGGWKYEVSNQDHSFMQGVEAAERILSEREEITYSFPEAIN